MASERLNPVDSSRTRARRASSSSRTDIASAMFKAQYHIVSYSRFGLGVARRETTRPDAPASPPGEKLDALSDSISISATGYPESA